MRGIFRLALFFSVFLLLIIGLWFRSEHLDLYPNEQTVIEQQAFNEQQSEDLVMTIELFMEQVKQDLLSFGNGQSDLKRLEEELNQHQHIDGFAAYDLKNKTSQFQVGEMSEEPFEKIAEADFKKDKWIHSNPFVVNGTKKMLMAINKNDALLLSEVDVSFIENFIKDIASVSDNQGNLFIGEDIDVSFNELELDMDETAVMKDIPDLGWHLYLQSEKDVTRREEYKKGEVIVLLDEYIDEEEWANDHQVYLINRMENAVVVRDLTRDSQQMIDDWTGDPSIKYMEPNYTFEKQTIEKQQQDFIPNDELYESYQWNLKELDLESAWRKTQGKERVSVAIVDSGIQPDHPDLENRIKNGYNAFEDSGNYHDEHGHGTHVAGTFGAITNNRDGIAGVTWDSPILAVKSLDHEAMGNSFSIAKGIYWATDQGAKVINLSLGDEHDSDVMHDAVKYAYENDVVLIAASGNDNVETPMYPAAYEEVLAVGSINHLSERSFFSNFGIHLDVTAPGEHIPSTYIEGEYVMMSGTSMAAPHVTGIASLLRSYDPNLSNEEVYAKIRKTAFDLGEPGHDPFHGFGAINPNKVIND